MKNIKTIGSKPLCCHNLRPDPVDIRRYLAVRKPNKLANEGFTPLLVLNANNVIMASSEGTAVVNIPTGEQRILTDEKGLCAFRNASGKIVVMTIIGPLTFRVNDDGTIADDADIRRLWAPVSVTAEPMAPLSMHIDPLALKGEYLPGDTMTAADTMTVLRAANDAYTELQGEAAGQGVFFQPVLARAVIKDHEGRVLFRGPERLVMPPGGLPFGSPLRLGAPSSGATARYTAEIPAYRLRVNCNSMNSHIYVSRAGRLSVEVVDVFHTWTDDVASGSGFVTVVREGSSGVTFSVTMPGNDRGLAVKNRDRNRRLVETALAAFPSLCRELPAAANPFKDGVNNVVASYGMPDLKTSMKVMAKGVQTPKHGNVPDRLSARLRMPHTFTAENVAATPTVVVYANPRLLSFPGFSPTDYAAVTDTACPSWKATTRVTFSDGSSCCRISQGAYNKPVELSPLIVYPDSSATGMEIVVVDGRSGQNALRWHFDLEAHTEADVAYCMTDSLQNAIPDAISPSTVIETKNRRRNPISFPGIVAVAPATDPFDIKSVADFGEKITALSTASSTTAAWDFGRTRFHVLTDRKIALMNVAAGCTTLSVSVPAKVGTPSPAAFTATDASVSFFISDRRFIYSVDGSHVKILCKTESDVDILGYDVADGRLMAASSTGSDPVYHINPRNGSIDMTTSSPGPFDSFFAMDSLLLAPAQDGLFDLAVANRDDAHDTLPVRIVWEVPERGSGAPMRIRKVLWNIDAASFNGELTLSRTSLSGRKALATRYSVNGRVGSAVVMPLAMRPSTACRLSVEGRVTPDAVIGTPDLII